LVINDLKGNGAERVVITLSKAFEAQGHSVNVICFNKTIEYDVGDLHVSYFPMRSWRWVPRRLRGRTVGRLLDKFILEVANGSPDLVLSNLLPCDRLLSESKLSNVYLVIHNVLSREHGAKFPEMFIYGKKPVVCVSEGVRKDYLMLFPQYFSKAVTIKNPVDAEWIRDQALLPSIKILSPYLIHVGKFKAEKRHDLLLKAFSKSTYGGLLVLVGQGPLEDSIRVLARELGVGDRVIFMGQLKNPFTLMKRADMLILCSDFEGLGMVLLEAISIGTPTISTDCTSGPNEILERHQLAPVGDSEALAKMLSVADFSVYRSALRDEFMLAYGRDCYLSLIA